MEDAINVINGIDGVLRAFLYVLITMGAYTITFTIIGLIFKPKKFKPTINKYKYAILIPARNEEKVIGQLIDSINKQDYIKTDKSLITIFVMADHCQDRTAEVAKKAGAIVYERPNPKKKERTMGYALKYLVEGIRKDHGIEVFDGYLLMNSDNLLSKDYMTKMNDAFDDKNFDMFSSYSDTKNFGTTLASSFNSIKYYSHMHYQRSKAILGLSPFCDGRGTLMRKNILSKTGFKWTGLTECNEFCYELISYGIRTTYIEDATYFDEQPLQFRIILRQCMRWSRGSFVAYLKYFTRLCMGVIIPYDFDKSYFTSPPRKGNIFKRALIGFQKRFSCFNELLHMTTLTLQLLITSIYPVCSIVFKICCPEYDLSMMCFNLIFYIIWSFIFEYTFHALAIIREHRKMRISPTKLFFYFLMWPIMKIIIDWVSAFAIFWPVKWKRIPHVIDHQIEDIYDTPTLSQTFSQ